MREAHASFISPPTFFQGYLLRHWFTLSLATSVPFVLLFSYYWIIPESPRWLLSKNRIDEAEVIVQRMAKINGKTVPNNFLRKMEVEKEEGEREREKERRRGSVDFSISQVEILRRQGISCNGTNSGDGSGEPDRENEDRSPPPAATPMDLIRNPNIRKKFFILAFDWVANAVVYNGLSYNATNLGVSDYLAFFIGKNLVASTNGLRTTAPLVNMFSHSIGSQSICKDTDLYAKFRYVCECVCFFFKRDSRDFKRATVIPFAYTIHCIRISVVFQADSWKYRRT